jgi:signal-transduction protein with cAMP-binding, CBS, and nucleotidyltransferase domain
VDISKCLFDVAGRMERALAASKVLMGDNDFAYSSRIDPQQIEFYSEIENRLFKPTLNSVMAHNLTTPSIGFKDTVESAVNVMIKSKANAVLVVNATMDVIGIFSSKDLVLRIVAAGLPFTTSIVRVMTPRYILFVR